MRAISSGIVKLRECGGIVTREPLSQGHFVRIANFGVWVRSTTCFYKQNKCTTCVEVCIFRARRGVSCIRIELFDSLTWASLPPYCPRWGAVMRDIRDVLMQKEVQLESLKREVEALRLVATLLVEQSDRARIPQPDEIIWKDSATCRPTKAW